MQDELEDLRDCGIGGCKPRILQALANIKVRERERRKKSMNDRAGSVDGSGRGTRLSRLRLITRRRRELSPGCVHMIELNASQLQP